MLNNPLSIFSFPRLMLTSEEGIKYTLLFLPPLVDFTFHLELDEKIQISLDATFIIHTIRVRSFSFPFQHFYINWSYPWFFSNFQFKIRDTRIEADFRLIDNNVESMDSYIFMSHFIDRHHFLQLSDELYIEQTIVCNMIAYHLILTKVNTGA